MIHAQAAAADLEASEALARQMAIDEKTWSKTGKFVGSQCRRFFMNKSGKGLPRVVDGKVCRKSVSCRTQKTICD